MRPSVLPRQNLPAVTSRVLSGTLNVVGHAAFGGLIHSTSTVSGVVTGNWSNLRGWVEAPVVTLVTDDCHLDGDRRASMDAARYPVLRFDLIRAALLTSYPRPAGSLDVLFHGALTIHRAAHVVDLTANVVRHADTIHVTTSFPVDLADYRIGSLTRISGLVRIEFRADLHVVRRRGRIPRSASQPSAAVPAFYSITNENLVS